MLKMKIKILSPISLQIKLYRIALHTFIMFDCFKTNFFLKLSQNTKFIKKQNNFYFISKKFSLYTFLTLKAFFLKLSIFFKVKKHLFCKKILLQGLGFKIISLSQNKFIELKIGYSHYVKIAIPLQNISLFTNKNMIIIEGCKKDKVGNFANKIKSFRVPDSYKGKGIWYKKETKKLKKVKKN